MKNIIEIDNVWKQYNKVQDRTYRSFRDTLSSFSDVFQRKEKMWALKNIDVQVAKGESIGIVGRNGAGKSTLLKILARVTPPTKGKVILRGRVASLLEVGTGFHPELSGRENIFFNGSILGMKHHEIKSGFDEIVEFSGVSQFIDTPIKHYSSGMKMRLAFSVAAHLPAEILLIDEVLAVGDIEFQRKCLGKMGSLSEENGRTVIFVSHDAEKVRQLCSKALYLQSGEMIACDGVETILQRYHSDVLTNQCIPEDQGGSGIIRVLDVRYKVEGRYTSNIPTLSDMDMVVLLKCSEELNSTDYVRIDVGINQQSFKRVAWMSTGAVQNINNNEITFSIKNIPLINGAYDCNIFIEVNGQISSWLKNVMPFNIVGGSNHQPKSQSDIYLDYSTNPNG